MDTKLLRQKILDLAIHGKLVLQDPNDEPASVLLERIKAEKERLIKEGKIKKSKKSSKTSDTPHYENVPFEIPSGWAWTRLGEIGIWQAGGTPSRSNKVYYGGNIPWLKTGDLNDGFIKTIPESITEEAVANSSAKINPEGSVLIAMYGATIGKLGILTFPATTNQACCACIEYYGISQQYLFFFLLSQRSLFIAKGGGGAQPNISKEIIVNTEIPLPSLAEQHRIVAEIEKWFALIDVIELSKDDLQNTIKQAKSKILDLAIHGKLVPQDPNDEPAMELLRRINPKAEITCDNAHYPFEVPSGWAWTTLGTICKFISGYAFSSNDYSEIGTKLIRISNIQSNVIDLNSCVCVEDPKIDSLYVKRGDLLIAMSGATTGKMGVYSEEEPALLNQRVGNIRIIDDSVLLAEYRNYFMNSMSDYILESAYGGAQPNISAKEISVIALPLPPIAEQQRIVAKIEELFLILDNIQNSLEV